MPIFVSIAAYCDPVLRFTIDQALAKAKHPDGIRFGIVDQSDAALASLPSTYLHLPTSAARGPCWARALAMSFYAGEDWYLQIDSHTDFDERWDEKLVEQLRPLGPKAALTAYPAALLFDGDKPTHATNKGAQVCTVLKGYQFQPGTPMLKFSATEVHTEKPIPAINFGAGGFFAPGRVVLEVPYDPALYFHGEEQSMFLRLYTRGWDLYHPPGMPIYHQYTDIVKAKRPLHHERDPKWIELEAKSQARLVALHAGADLGVYGLGTARTLADYARASGIDYQRRIIEPRAYVPTGAAQRITIPTHATFGATGFGRFT